MSSCLRSFLMDRTKNQAMGKTMSRLQKKNHNSPRSKRRHRPSVALRKCIREFRDHARHVELKTSVTSSKNSLHMLHMLGTCFRIWRGWNMKNTCMKCSFVSTFASIEGTCINSGAARLFIQIGCIWWNRRSRTYLKNSSGTSTM